MSFRIIVYTNYQWFYGTNMGVVSSFGGGVSKASFLVLIYVIWKVKNLLQ